MRAFLAVELDKELRANVTRVQQSLRDSLSDATEHRARITWTRPDTMHLTVKFLGDIDERHAPMLLDEVRQVVGQREAFKIPFERLGCFPRPQVPRVLWIGPASGWEQSTEAKDLDVVVREIDRRCAGLGVAAEEQRWHPHLTVARVRSGERVVGRRLAETGVLESQANVGRLHVGAIALVKSDLKPDGPIHSRLWQVDFAA